MESPLNSPQSPHYAFAGTAPFYVRYRVPYPSSLIKDLAYRSHIAGTGRLLDLACGPGRLTLVLAPLFQQAWAIDIEPEMIEAGKKEAARIGASNILWRVGKAEDLDAPAAAFDMISVGEAFHRLDQPKLASRALTWLKPGRCIAILGSYSVLSGREPWQAIVLNVLSKWTHRSQPDGGPTPQQKAKGDPKHHERILRDTGFSDVGTYSFLEAHEWTLDSILGFLYSTSVCSRPILGKNVPAFEEDMRKALLAYEPAGLYREQIQWGYTLGQKPL